MAGDPDIHILPLPPGSDIKINALQRASTIVVQKSLREGFALTISEALWKSKPVVASATELREPPTISSVLSPTHNMHNGWEEMDENT